MNNIRVTYSGLIAYTTGLLSLVGGLFFIIVVTRKLTPEEFGSWSLIFNIIGYFLVSESIIFFWTMRQVARGENVAKTSLFSTGLFSIGVIPFYLFASYFLSTKSNSDFDAMLFAVFLVPLFFFDKILTGINMSYKPQKASYALLIFESIKIPSAIGFVYFLGLGLEGAIISIGIAYVIKNFVMIYYARSIIKGKIKLSYLKNWIKLSWISVYTHVPKILTTLDVFVYTIIIGSVSGVAFYAAAYAITNVILQSTKISAAVYPKLLAEQNPEHFKENFSLLLYFSIPMLTLVIIFAKPALFILNPVYSDASTLVIILGFHVFFAGLNEIFRGVLLGMETVDIEKNPSMHKMLKSKLFQTSTFWSTKSAIYITVLTSVLLISQNSNYSEIDLITFWGIILISIEIPFFIFILILVRKTISFPFPSKNFLKYVGVSIIFGIVYILSSEYIIHYDERIFHFLPGVIVQFIICAIIYLSITYIIDKRTRKLFSSIIKELKTK